MGSGKKKISFPKGTIPAFIGCFALMSVFILSPFTLGGFLTNLGVSAAVGYFYGKLRKIGKIRFGSEKAEKTEERSNVANTKKTSERVGKAAAPAEKTAGERLKKKSYGEKIDPILEEGDRALGEMRRLKTTITDPAVQGKIDEIMDITEKIAKDAIEDPSDVPQIKKFFRYYLPTTIKLLNAYDRMSSQGIDGENIDKSLNNINEMLDVAIAAYKKRLDSLFENQALDIETDIDVMNQMLEREGLSGRNEFEKLQAAGSAAQQSSAAAAQQKG